MYPSVIDSLYTSVASLAAKVIAPLEPVWVTASAGGFGAYLIDFEVVIFFGFTCSMSILMNSLK